MDLLVASLKSDMSDKDKAMKKILSSDQYALYEKNKEAMQAAIKEKKQEKKTITYAVLIIDLPIKQG